MGETKGSLTTFISMVKVFICMLALMVSASAQTLFSETRAQVHPEEPGRTFRILGDKERSAFNAYGIHIVSDDGKEQVLDQFEALLPEGSESDVLYVEDINFDGFADIRLVKYLTGGANVPYLYWLFDPVGKEFVSAPQFEVIVSPEIDHENKLLVSRQRASAAEYRVEYYDPLSTSPILVRREERTFQPDGSSVLKVYTGQGAGNLKLVETRELPPE